MYRPIFRQRRKETKQGRAAIDGAVKWHLPCPANAITRDRQRHGDDMRRVVIRVPSLPPERVDLAEGANARALRFKLAEDPGEILEQKSIRHRQLVSQEADFRRLNAERRQGSGALSAPNVRRRPPGSPIGEVDHSNWRSR